jgi:hypothetical protein
MSIGRKVILISMGILILFLVLGCGQKHEVKQEIKKPSEPAPNKTSIVTAEVTVTEKPAEPPKPEHFCRDGVCDSDEDRCSCPEDCGICEEQKASFCFVYYCNEDSKCTLKKNTPCCGDGLCDSSETCSNCMTDCCKLEDITGPRDLKDFPRLIERMSTVVADKAPSSDVVAASEIVEPMLAEGYKFGDSLLVSDVSSISDGRYIIVGTPCENQLAAQLLAKEIMLNNGNCSIFDEHEGLIKIYATSDETIALLVTGSSSYDVRMAARVLSEYKNHTLQGVAVKVNGSMNSFMLTRLQ